MDPTREYARYKMTAEELCAKWRMYIYKIAWTLSRQSGDLNHVDDFAAEGYLGLAKVQPSLYCHDGYVSKAIKNTMMTYLYRLRLGRIIPANRMETLEGNNPEHPRDIAAPAHDLDVRMDLEKLFSVLTKEELPVMRLVARDGAPRHNVYIGQELGITPNRVDQLYNNAMRRMRRYVAGKPMRVRGNYKRKT